MLAYHVPGPGFYSQHTHKKKKKRERERQEGREGEREKGDKNIEERRWQLVFKDDGHLIICERKEL
jgi:hypothetical protein